MKWSMNTARSMLIGPIALTNSLYRSKEGLVKQVLSEQVFQGMDTMVYFIDIIYLAHYEYRMCLHNP